MTSWGEKDKKHQGERRREERLAERKTDKTTEISVTERKACGKRKKLNNGRVRVVVFSPESSTTREISHEAQLQVI